MERVSTYLNFMGKSEEAFTFYASVFGTRDPRPDRAHGRHAQSRLVDPNAPKLTDAEKKMVMHIEVPILAGHILMATDMLESMGHQTRVGNNTTINLELQDRAETDRMLRPARPKAVRR